MTGTQLGRLLADARIENSSRESTKWRRLRDNLEARQQKDGHGNAVARFIQLALEPVRFTSNPEAFERHREAIKTPGSGWPQRPERCRGKPTPALNIPPDVRIIAGNLWPRPGKRSLYLAYATDHDGGVARVEWDTDADAFDDATGERLLRAFPVGVRTLGVRVTGNSGGRTTDTLRVEVARR